jgi:hypothetical protein
MCDGKVIDDLMRVKQFRLEKGFKKPKLEAFEIKKL